MKAQIRRREGLAAQLPVLEQHQLIGPLEGGLIQAAMAMKHHGPALTKDAQRFRHRLQLLRTRHPQHLGLRPQGVHQGAELVEHGAHPQAASQGGQTGQGWMPAGRKQEGDPRQR